MGTKGTGGSAALRRAARLGVDKERRFLLDSLAYRRAVWNPLPEAWQTLALLDAAGAQVSDWPVVDTQRVHVLGHRRYKFAKHLGNVLAVASDRKILVDSLHNFNFYEADIYSLAENARLLPATFQNTVVN